ncbi:PREDICTED: uncharacterized protein At4g26485-like [Erythranthe guttata]|uniref:uncharacterized protein At4g26485-like n=1 Tax=Erythranthe guttata TaxID=4155 RepID=UPI00064DDA80|nr:PREDICTED: uncharacterized protein At4g26485-like [Erythranthe guttata]|eukprot:XP_012848371.1 PREDICTED: uncharacterized protein At4g26485-like [Erythranthe guttata]
MGILQSVLQNLGNGTDAEENNSARDRNNARYAGNCEYYYRYSDYDEFSYTKTRPVVSENGGKSSSSSSLRPAVKEPPKLTVRWIKHYSSSHRILLVGDGDFSFSACLAVAFGSASNMIATSLDSQNFLMRNYRSASSNLMELKIRECKVMHEIDATEIANHPIIGRMKFDRIVFNFPFAGFFKELSRDAQLLRHRKLVSEFMKSAREIISEGGEIHILHKTNGFHKEWKLESLALSHGLRLIDAVDFNGFDYPGYNTKCGFGGDNNFNCYPSKTYKFRLGYNWN